MNCVYWQQFPEVILNPCSNIFYTSFFFNMRLKVTGIGFCLCFYAKILWILYFFKVILCIVSSEINCWTIWPHFIIWSTLFHPCLWMPLSYPPMILSPVTTERVYPWDVFSEHSTTFPVFGWPSPNLLKCVAAISQWAYIYKKCNVKYVAFVLFSIEDMSKRISQLSYSV